jgi:hypothetical protein
MYLQNHLQPRHRGQQVAVDPQHRDLDDVGRGTLHRRVDRDALGGLPDLAVAAEDVRQIPPAVEEGRDVPLPARELRGLPHILGHRRISGKIGLHELRRFAPGDPQLSGQRSGPAHKHDATSLTVFRERILE